MGLANRLDWGVRDGKESRMTVEIGQLADRMFYPPILSFQPG